MKMFYAPLALLIYFFILPLSLFSQQKQFKDDPAISSLEPGSRTAAPFSVLFKEDAGYKLADAPQLFSKYLGSKPGELKLKTHEVTNGITFDRFQQYFKGITVEHGSYVIVAKNDKVSYITGDFFTIDPSTRITPSITEDAARIKARLYLDGIVPVDDERPAGELVFVERGVDQEVLDGKVHLAYKFLMGSHTKALTIEDVYVDAATGEVLFTNLQIMAGCYKSPNAGIKNAVEADEKKQSFSEKINTNKTGNAAFAVAPLAATIYSGNVTNMVTRLVSGSYRLEATVATELYPTHVKNILHAPVSTYTLVSQFTAAMAASTEVTDADNSWTAAEFNNANHDNTALDVQWGAQRVYDYWKTRHSRSSWDNADGVLNCYVHADNNFNNAFWQGSGGINSMFYGDGSYTAGNFTTLTSLDVTGHEIGHGVCQATSNLTYSNQSGAMNEGFSDIWGASIEHFGDPHEVDAVAKSYFDIGEEIMVSGGALRSMSNPKLYGQPDTYLGTNWYTGTGDNGGVHTNSGVLNYWFYLLVMGKTGGTNDLGNPYSVPAIGWVDAERIAFLGETSLTTTATYSTCRTAMINAATTLFGACSLQTEAVTRAWYAVGVGVDFVPCTPQVMFNGFSQTVTETGNTGATCLKTKTVTVPVKIAIAATQSATVSFTLGGNASNAANGDYTISPATVTFPAMSTTIQNLTVTIYNDAYVEGTDTILINISGVSTTGNAVVGNAFQQYAIYITDDDYAPSIHTLLLNQTIYSEDFTVGAGFTQATSASPVNFWRIGNNAGTNTYFGAVNNCAYVSNSTAAFAYTVTSAASIARLQTPVINASNTTNLQLTFDYVCNGEFSGGTYWDYGTLWYSINGGTTWLQMNSTAYQGVTVKTTITVPLPANANNAASLMLGFRWDNDASIGAQPPFGIDNIVLKGDKRVPATVQSSVNTGVSSDQQYLGPNATVNFYDNVTNNVMGTIQNLSSFDYGCTTFEVDRAGTSALFVTGDVSGNNAQRLSSKTFKVTPTTNSPSGNYRITLYYTAAEKAGYESASTRLWIADNGGNNGVRITKAPGQISSLTTSSGNAAALIESVGTYGTDFTITASFTNGFSGFAAGIPPLSALPVTLVDFNAVRSGSTVLVKWKVDQQINIKNYEVEHSADGTHFTGSGTVVANGMSSAQYGFTDIHPVTGINYYRLKIIDANGSYRYSGIATVNFEVKDNSLVVNPNPVLNKFTIQYNAANTVQSIIIFNEQGTKIKAYNPANPVGSLFIDAGSFAPGLYFVRMVDCSNKVITQKFIKQ